MLLFYLIITLLLLPVALCNMLSSSSIRMIVVFIATASYLIILSLLTRARTIELAFSVVA
jgi:hypothetical protein